MSGRPALSVLVVDAERTLAEALVGCARADRPWQARAAGGAVDALHLLELEPVDIVVVGLASLDGAVALVREIARHHGPAAVVVLTPTPSQLGLAELVRAGMQGWAHKQQSVDHVLRVVQAVGAGDWWLPRSVMGDALRSLSRCADSTTADRLASLTLRERQVLLAMSEGLPRAAIASRLRLSVNTVRTHVQHLLAKLEVHNSLEAVALALREGLADPLPAATAAARAQGA
jgi:DNA-binding NarL/FixJ family response regulator